MVGSYDIDQIEEIKRIFLKDPINQSYEKCITNVLNKRITFISVFILIFIWSIQVSETMPQHGFCFIHMQQIVLMTLLLSVQIGLACDGLSLYSYIFSILLRQATSVASDTLNAVLYRTIKRSHASLFSTCCLIHYHLLNTCFRVNNKKIIEPKQTFIVLNTLCIGSYIKNAVTFN